MSCLRVELGERGYDIHIGRGLLKRVGELFDLNRKVFIVTDEGVPAEYAREVSHASKESVIVTVPMGEGSKSIECFGYLLEKMIEFGMTRTDCAVAVGGGVVGDLTGFVAASYMRGIDFYNIPTTLLAEVDSSIGGKVAVNHGGTKNSVGAFHQPKGVLIDPDTLKTLPKRQIANGLAEAVKMAMTSDKELFRLFEEAESIDGEIENIILRSLKIKKAVVEADEREMGIRKILNFGHTLGHGVEAQQLQGGLLHGECVAIGMCAISCGKVRERLVFVLEKLGLPTEYDGDINEALSLVAHDKKCDGRLISIVLVDEIGSYKIEKMSVEDFEKLALSAYQR